MIRLGFLTVFMLLNLAWETPAAVVDETDLDVQVREIAKTLRCTVCQTENIWESGAPLAKQMRDAIRERLVQGQSPEDIRAYFLSRYGDYILMQPPKRGVNWLIWIAPFLLLFIGGLFLYKEVSHWVRNSAPPAQDQPPPLDQQARERVERERQS